MTSYNFDFFILKTSGSGRHVNHLLSKMVRVPKSYQTELFRKNHKNPEIFAMWGNEIISYYFQNIPLSWFEIVEIIQDDKNFLIWQLVEFNH